MQFDAESKIKLCTTLCDMLKEALVDECDASLAAIVEKKTGATKLAFEIENDDAAVRTEVELNENSTAQSVFEEVMAEIPPVLLAKEHKNECDCSERDKKIYKCIDTIQGELKRITDLLMGGK